MRKLLCSVFLLLAMVSISPNVIAQASTSTYPCRTTSTSPDPTWEREGCVDPKIMWKYYSKTYNVERYFNDKYTAARALANARIKSNPNMHWEAMQTGPIDHHPNCNANQNSTDNSYVTYQSSPTNKMSFPVHVYGWHNPSNCSITQLSSDSGVPPMVYAEAFCPINYEKYRSVVDNLNEPFGYVCVPKKSSIYVPPMCSDNTRNSEGACTTNYPITLSKYKQEQVIDLKTTGPWPITWSRSYSSLTKLMWQFDNEKHFQTSILSSGIGASIYKTNNNKTVTFRTNSSATPTGNGVGWLVYQGTVAEANKVQVSLNHEFVNGEFVYTITDKNGYKEKFKNGKLVERENPQGFKHFYSYGDYGKLSRIEDEFGHFIQVNYKENYGFQNYDIDLVTYTGSYGTGRVSEPMTVSYFPDSNAAIQFNMSIHLPESVTDGTRSISYTWDDGGTTTALNAYYLRTVTDSDGNIMTYNYGEVVKTKNQPKTLLTGKIDGENRRISTYHAEYNNDAVTQEWRGGDVNGNGAKETLTFNGLNIIDQNGFTLGTSTDVNFPGKAKTLTYKAPYLLGNIQKSYTYDAYGNVVTSKDFNNNTEKRTYDTENRVLTQTLAFGTSNARTTTYTYSSNRKFPDTMTEQVLVNGVLENRLTSYTYNSRNQVTQIDVSWNGQTRTTIINYNSQGLPESVQTPHAQTAYLYNTKGQVTSIIEGIATPLERTTTLSNYHANGLPQTVSYPDGTQKTYTYSVMGKLLSETSSGQTTSYVYDLGGLPMQINYFDGTKDIISYSSSLKIESITRKDSSNNILYVTSFDRDGMNQVTTTTVTRNGVTDFTQSQTYNKLGEIENLIDANTNQTSFVYNGEGDVLSETTPLNRVHTNTYDSLNRLTSQVLPNNGNTSFQYGADDDVSVAQDAKTNQTVYQYNGFGDVISLQSPDSGLTTFTYDQGRLTSKTDARGVVENYTYDDLNRLTQIQTSLTNLQSTQIPFVHNGAKTVSLSYDNCPNGIGKVCSISDDQGSSSFSYDTLGRIQQTARTDHSLNITINSSQTYDSFGRVSTMTYPSGKVLSYTYDQNSQIQSINYNNTTVVENVSYNALGQVLSFDWGQAHLSGLGQSFVYDQTGSINLITSHLQNWSFGKNTEGEITSIVNSANSNLNQTYQYNNMGEIIQTEVGVWNTPKNYTFDLVGNRLSTLDNTNSGTSNTIESSSNKLLSAQTLNNNVPASILDLSYDNNGNIVGNNQGDTIKYNSLNRLSFWNTSTQTTTMYYNGFNQRTKKIVTGNNPEVTLEFYDQSGRLIGVYYPNSNGGIDIKEELIYLDNYRSIATVRPDQSLGMSNPQIHPIVTDHIGSPRYILSSSSSVPLWSWGEYEPFGFQAPNENLTSINFEYNGRFAGQRFDSSTNSSHNGFRTYSSQFGRYMQSDPLGLIAGFNTYAYVGNNPVSFTDYLGLACDQRGCWNTKQERIFAKNGDWDLYYKTACRGGDAYACRAFEVASQTSGDPWYYLGAIMTNARLEQSIKKQNPNISTCEIDEKMEKIRVGLMKVYTRLLPNEEEDKNGRRVLIKNDISKFHKEVFKANNAGDAFGGDLPFANDIFPYCVAPGCIP